jgi:hypothetical protein
MPLRTWARVLVPSLCGLCGRSMARGEMVQLIHVAGITKRRCVACADSEPPPNLPDHIEVTTGRVVPSWATPLLPFVPKTEREPGEEG